MAPGSEHRSPIRTDYIAKNSTQGIVNNFLMGLSDSGHLQAQRENYAPQYHNVVGLSRIFPIYWGHKAPAKVVVENCQARQSKEASAASDLFGRHSPSPPLPPRRPRRSSPQAPPPVQPVQRRFVFSAALAAHTKSSRSWVTPYPPHDGVGSVVS